MDFNTAVQKAINGDSESFEYLYNSTFYNMLYLAMKYVKNENNAELVVEEAYERVRKNMGMLNEPENFKSWLGCIVANTAVNSLKKNKPLIFSAVGGDENNGESFLYDVQDDNELFQPEKFFNKKDTKYLVQEMINTLSDEQRVCIVMYHFDGQSIDNIADSLNCSENTIRSRLYYGRNELRKKIKFLNEHGYPLKAAAPIPFLLYLLKAEKALPEMQNIGKKAMDKHSGLYNSNIFPQSENNITTESMVNNSRPANENLNSNDSQIRYEIIQSGMKSFLGTATGKITTVVLAAVIVGSTAAAVNLSKNGFNGLLSENTSADTENGSSSNHRRKPRDSDSVSSYQDDNVKTLQWHMVTEELYPKLVSGHLTKEQLEFVLARLPDDYDSTNNTIDNETYINMFCSDIAATGSEKGFTPPGSSYSKPDFKVKEINQIFASFKDYSVTKENFTLGEYKTLDSGDVIVFDVKNNKERVSAYIATANYDDVKMELIFYSGYYGDNINIVKKKTVRLDCNQDGLYRITRIITEEESMDTDNPAIPAPEPTITDEAPVESKKSEQDKKKNSDKSSTPSNNNSSSGTQTQTTIIYEVPGDSSSNVESTTSGTQENVTSSQQEQPQDEPVKDIKDLYNEILQQHTDCRYLVFDMDNDGTKELIIVPNETNSGDAFFYTCTTSDSGYELMQLDSNIQVNAGGAASSQSWLAMSNEGEGLYLIHNSAELKEGYRVYKEGHSVLVNGEPDFTYNMIDDEKTGEDNSENISWIPCTDPIDEL